MKVAFYTLGCKVNQNETAALEEMFRRGGYEMADVGGGADIYVVNSCTVTAGGDAKSRQWLRRAKRENPAAVAVLTGCFPQAFPGEALLPEADVITGTVGRGRLLANVEQFLATREQVVDIAPHVKGEAFEELPAEGMAGRTRIFVKIQDGCNRRCAYCIIPQARGAVRSRARENIVAELAAHAARGCAEVVFTGINLPSYGQDTGENLADIVEAAARVRGIARIRLSSLDPDLITPEQIRRFAAVGKLCGQFHLSLQSGCAATLRRMRRPYTPEAYRAAATALRAAMPHASLTTDVIVGFPGETEEEFAESVAFVREMRFLKVHVFPYSARPGTPAADFVGQVPGGVKTQRVHAMQAAADEVRAEWIAEQKNTRQRVLLEAPLPDGRFTGYTESYIPIVLDAPHAQKGEIVEVMLGGFDGERCGCVCDKVKDGKKRRAGK